MIEIKDERFEFLSNLGEGGMGKVYKVYDAESEKTCALKISKYFDEETNFEKTVSEATLWFKFRKFAQVVEVFEIIRFEENIIGILMEYLEGGNLRVLSNLKASHDDKLLALFDISSAIISCRSIVPGFAHLDLKPENCLRTNNGLTKLSDFGLSCHVASDLKNIVSNNHKLNTAMSIPLQTKRGIRCAGTPLYMAPEQILGSVINAEKSDVYSFSLMALELLSGEHPLIKLGSLEEVFDAHILGINPNLKRWPRNLNKELIKTLDRALIPIPGHRPSMEEINEQLKSAFTGPRVLLATNQEKLADSLEDASRKAKSLWALNQNQAAISILKNNLQIDPFQADLWYYLTKWEWDLLSEYMSSPDFDMNTFTEKSKSICAYAFRARILDEKYSQENHEDYKFLNLILPQMAAQEFITKKNMDGYYKWGREFLAEQRNWLNSQEVKIVESGGPVRCLCVKCGEIKMHITMRCPRCGFLPTEMIDIYHTYTLRIEALRFSDTNEEPPYWQKMNYLKQLGKNITKTIHDLCDDPKDKEHYDRFVQNEGKFLYQAINFRGSKDEMANIKEQLTRMNIIRPSKRSNLKEKIKNIFK